MITGVEINPTFLVSPKNNTMFKNVIDFLVAHFERNVDKTCKKHISLLFKDLFIDFSGLYLNTEAIQ